MITVLYVHEHAEVSGGETSLLALWEALDRSRFEPVLVAPPSGPFVDRARLLGVRTCPMRFPRLRELTTPRSFAAIAALAGHVRALDAAVLHGNTPRTNVVAACVGRWLRRAVVWHERVLRRHGEWDVEPWLGWLPHRIVCNSLAVARRFRGPGRRVVVVHNGVPVDRFVPGAGGARVRGSLGLTPADVAVGIVGNFSRLKNHELFLHAAARLRAMGTRARFVIVGGEVFDENRGREATIRREAVQLGVGDTVSFLGVRPDMPAVMDALDVLVSAAEVEACSRAIIEAMACGTPVIGVNAGGTPELVVDGETGWLVPPGDPGALADRLHLLVTDAWLRKRMGEAARGRAEREFSVARYARAIESVYESMLRTA